MIQVNFAGVFVCQCLLVRRFVLVIYQRSKLVRLTIKRKLVVIDLLYPPKSHCKIERMFVL